MRALGVALAGVVGLVLLAQGLPLDFPLVLTVLEGLFGSPARGALTGLFLGLAQDFLGGAYLGLHAVAKSLVGLACGMAERRFFRDNPLLPLLSLALATLAENLAYGLGGTAVGWSRGLGPPPGVGEQILVNVLVGMAVYALFYRPRRRRPWKRESWTRSLPPSL